MGHEHLAVAMNAGADADGGNVNAFADQFSEGSGMASRTSENAPASSSDLASSIAGQLGHLCLAL